MLHSNNGFKPLYPHRHKTFQIKQSHPLLYLPYLHEVADAFFTEDVSEEDQVLFMVCIRVELRCEKGQSLVQPCEEFKKIIFFFYNKLVR